MFKNIDSQLDELLAETKNYQEELIIEPMKPAAPAVKEQPKVKEPAKAPEPAKIPEQPKEPMVSESCIFFL